LHESSPKKTRGPHDNRIYGDNTAVDAVLSTKFMTRWLPKLLTLLMACAVAAIASYWVMKIAGGPPAPDPKSLNRAMDAPVQSFREPVSLFGNAQTQAVTNVKLLGLIAGKDGKGRAILTVNDGLPKHYAAGTQVAPGMLLKAVEQNAVVLDSNGVESRIPVPPRTSLAANAISAAAGGGPVARPAYGAAAAAQAAAAQAPPAPAIAPAAAVPAPATVPQAAINAATAAAQAAAAAQAQTAGQLVPAPMPANPLTPLPPQPKSQQ
jgi:general secretion pathway protein C